MIEKLNLTMLTDFYEITMANGYFCSDMADDIAYFDMFFRRIPDGGGYAVMVVETDQVISRQALDWLESMDGILKVTFIDVAGEV